MGDSELEVERLRFEGQVVEIETPRAVRGKVEVQRSTRESRHKKVVSKRVDVRKELTAEVEWRR